MPISWSRDAADDLETIYLFVRQHNARAAMRILHSIRAKASLLKEFPNLGPALDRGVRRLTITGTPYVMIYELTNGGVSVLRVFDSRQDWQRQIDEP